MTAPLANPAPAPRRKRRAVLWVALALVAGLVLANAHLVYVAVTSQPECVAHLKQTGPAGSFQAAKSSC